MKASSIIFLSLLTFCSMADNNIKSAVNYQLENYPSSRLTDIYKSFFQDFYGPGHLIENPEASINYLKRELEEVGNCTLKNPVESTGHKNQFVRVDLSLIKEGKISLDDFSRLFIKSAESFQLPDIEEWKAEWLKILLVIEGMDIEIPGFEQDKSRLNEMLEKGEYVVHHSEEYIEEYDVHYRIIRRDLVEGYFGK